MPSRSPRMTVSKATPRAVCVCGSKKISRPHILRSRFEKVREGLSRSPRASRTLAPRNRVETTGDRRIVRAAERLALA